jgi:hypothetical protein
MTELGCNLRHFGGGVELPFLWLVFELACASFATASYKRGNQAQLFIRGEWQWDTPG